MEIYNYNELGLISRQKVMHATKRNANYLAYALERLANTASVSFASMGCPATARTPMLHGAI